MDPGYFSATRIPLLRGRLLSRNDADGREKAAVISESFARQVFPGEDPIGNKLDLGFYGNATIVGIVKDIRAYSLYEAPLPAFYVARAQFPSFRMCLMARISGDSHAVAPALRRVIHELDSTLPLMNVETVDQIIADSQSGRRFYTTATAGFAALALALTGIGLVAIITRSVAERRRELAIRSALGARQEQLIAIVVRQGLQPVLVGVALGLFGSWSGARILEQFLFAVKFHDPVIYAGVSIFALCLAALACYLPARRTGDVAPAEALKAE